MGVKRLVLLGSYRVEKSYFGSPYLEAGAIRAELVLGLEQARDTILPEVSLRRFFKPFVEDELEATFPERARLLRAPCREQPAGVARACPPQRACCAIGPEGGWSALRGRARWAPAASRRSR